MLLPYGGAIGAAGKQFLNAAKASRTPWQVAFAGGYVTGGVVLSRAAAAQLSISQGRLGAQAVEGYLSHLYATGYSITSYGGGNSSQSSSAQSNLEGKIEYDVIDPVTKNIITDIDHIKDGILWEKKSPQWAQDVTNWVEVNIVGKFNKYMNARQHLKGYESAPIGWKFEKKILESELTEAIVEKVKSISEQNPTVKLILEFLEGSN